MAVPAYDRNHFKVTHSEQQCKMSGDNFTTSSLKKTAQVFLAYYHPWPFQVEYLVHQRKDRLGDLCLIECTSPVSFETGWCSGMNPEQDFIKRICEEMEKIYNPPSSCGAGKFGVTLCTLV